MVDIIIPGKFKKSTPSEKKIEANIEYFKEHGEFKEPIYISTNGELIDGYTRYLAALKMDVDPMDYVEVKNKKRGIEYFSFHFPFSDDGIIFEVPNGYENEPLSEIRGRNNLKGAGKENKYESRSDGTVYFIEDREYFKQRAYDLWEEYLIDSEIFCYQPLQDVPSVGNTFNVEFEYSNEYSIQFMEDGSYVEKGYYSKDVDGVYYRDKELILMYAEGSYKCAVLYDNELGTSGYFNNTLLPRMCTIRSLLQEQDAYTIHEARRKEESESLERIYKYASEGEASGILLTEEENSELIKKREKQESDLEKYKEKVLVTRMRTAFSGSPEGKNLMKIYNNLLVLFPSLGGKDKLDDFIDSVFPSFESVPCVVRLYQEMYDNKISFREKYGVYLKDSKYLRERLPSGINLLFIGRFIKREWVIESIRILERPKLTKYDTETLFESRGEGKMRYNIFCDSYFPVWDFIEDRNIEIDSGTYGFDICEFKLCKSFPRKISLYNNSLVNTCDCSGYIWEKTIAINEFKRTFDKETLFLESARKCKNCGMLFVDKNEYFLNKQVFDEEVVQVLNLETYDYNEEIPTLYDEQSLNILDDYEHLLDDVQKTLYSGLCQSKIRNMDETALEEYLNDKIPENILEKNLLLMSYRENIINELLRADYSTVSDYVEKLVVNCGLYSEKAEWAIKTWIIILNLWKRECFKDYLGTTDYVSTFEQQNYVMDEKPLDVIITFTETPLEECGCCHMQTQTIKYKILEKANGSLVGRKCPKCKNLYFRFDIFKKYPNDFNIIGYYDLSRIGIIKNEVVNS